MNRLWVAGCLLLACANAPLRRTASASVDEAYGTVVLSVTVNELGAVTNVVVLEGPGSALNELAADALRKVRFKPALKDGLPTTATIIYRSTFLPED
ncbi:MAG: energy transducer TonB [Archangium sp.]|nr:energy transducer TonB [Archangium sp.]